MTEESAKIALLIVQVVKIMTKQIKGVNVQGAKKIISLILLNRDVSNVMV